ncbi:hypothetical protein LAWI1_G001452 [Lachnellula willkommii]|uniref:Heterokaryon incompatibility domain-containing protein n=1 Tax=Lachnellula willkommii TaxID=215461 RepID=A0A559MI63_9HELO|nr:hypothetical protein LAWI1_G001452 [Lachnellula willkommii]
MLCRSCTGITLKALSAQPGYPHSNSFKALEASSKTCSLCALLWDAASKSPLFNRRSSTGNSEDPIYLRRTKAPDDDDKFLRAIQIVSQRLAWSSDDDEWLSVLPEYDLESYVEQYGAVALYSHPTPCLKYGSPAGDDHNLRMGQKENLDINFSLPNTLPADQIHERDTRANVIARGTREIELPRRLPSRVIDVGPSNGSQVPHLHVCEQPEEGFWIALSHCWGSIPLLRTTTQTLSKHKQGMPMSSLPPSFRDAVIITRELGIRYLWIDSLCIVQDNLDDWRKESAEMSRIYGMSFLTIIAAGASNSQGGCFVPRVTRFPPVEIHPVDSPGPFFAREYIEIFNRQIDHHSREPIDRRGWCFQESVLPKRTLSYGTKMMTWRCQMGSFSEQGNYKSEPWTLYHETELSSYGYSRWEFIVQEYTSRSFTYEKDKLIALAGVAEELSRIWKDTYLAGIWGGDVNRQLLWAKDGIIDRTTGSEIKATRPTQFRAPSWSWAAINGPILFRANWMQEYKSLAELIDTEVIALGNTPFGEVSSGVLKLRSTMERVMGQWDFTDRHASVAKVTSSITPESYTTCFLDIPEERDWASTELWCLRLVSTLSEPGWIEKDPNVRVMNAYGLLLVATGKADEEYIRVGIAKLDFEAPAATEVKTITLV